MKKFKPFIVLALITSLFLTACEEESGFSIVRNTDYVSSEVDEQPNQDLSDDVSHSGSSGGSNKDDVDGESQDPFESEGNPHTGEEGNGNVIDLSSKVTTFGSTCIKINEEGFANITFDGNPFEEKLNFAYYTINDEKLSNSAFNETEMVDDTLTYKMFLGATDNGTYIIKFYNSESNQYGRAEIHVHFVDHSTPQIYIAVAFNIIQVRMIALRAKILEGFKKIGDFFSDLMSTDKISM